MRILRPILFSTLWIVGLGLLYAQTPEGTLSPKVAMDTHWRVDFTYADQKQSATGKESAVALTGKPPRLTSIEYILTGRTGKIINLYADGTSAVRYWKDRYELVQVAPGGEIRVKEIPGASPARGFLQQYPGLEWISPRTLVGPQDVSGEHCLYFRKSEPLARYLEVDPESLVSNPDVVWEAWISQGSGQPVAFSFYGTSQRFVFLPPPTQTVELPEPYQAALDKDFKPGPRPGESASRAR